MRKLLNKKKQGGFTLIEIMLVIAIGAILLITGLGLFGDAGGGTKLDSATKSISLLQTKIENRYRTASTSEEGLDNVIAVQGSLVPSTLKSKADGTIVNEFGGAVLIGVQGTDGYFVEYAKVPKSLCPQIVSQYYKKFSSITVGGTSVLPNATQATIGQACSASDELVVRFIKDQI